MKKTQYTYSTLPLLMDNRHESFIPFKNGVVHITKDEIELLKYNDVEIDDSTFDSLQRMSPQALVSGAPQMGQGGQEIVESFPFMKLDRDLIRGDFNFKIVSG